jgi:hypothetical protein
MSEEYEIHTYTDASPFFRMSIRHLPTGITAFGEGLCRTTLKRELVEAIEEERKQREKDSCNS